MAVLLNKAFRAPSSGIHWASLSLAAYVLLCFSLLWGPGGGWGNSSLVADSAAHLSFGARL